MISLTEQHPVPTGEPGHEVAEPTLPCGWTAETRFAEFGGGPDGLGPTLADEGLPLHATFDSADWLRRVDADVAILNAGTIRALWMIGLFRRFGHVLVRRGDLLRDRLALPAIARGLLRGHLARRGSVTLGGTRFQVFEHLRCDRRGPRFAIPGSLGVRGFLRRLDKAGVRHVVLRWHEQLDRLGPDEDVDLLVADEDCATVTSILRSGVGTHPVDVFGVSGAPGFDYRGMAYLPPRLAEQVLLDRRHDDRAVHVPSPEHAWLTLAFHAVYQKGTLRGEDHDYGAALTKAAVDDLPRDGLTLERLEAVLTDRGWRPPEDTLDRLAPHNEWLRRYREGTERRHDPRQLADDHELIVFLLRQRAVDQGLADRIAALIEGLGFSVVVRRPLAAAGREELTAHTRGGNWNRGPWPVSGGPPSELIAAVDLNPLTPTDRQRQEFPDVRDARVLRKTQIRDLVNAECAPAERFNAVHSSDNTFQSWQYLRHVLSDGERAALTIRINELVHAYRTDEPIDGALSRNANRAKVELIRRGGARVVRKTFRPGYDRFLQREIIARRELSKTIGALPPLLAAGPNWIESPFYRSEWHEDPRSLRLMPLAAARQLAVALRALYDEGYALLDVHPANVLYNRRDGLKIVDLEHLHRYEVRPPHFRKAYDIAGAPADFDGEMPLDGVKTWSRHWLPVVGVGVHSLLRLPTWLLQLLRIVHWIFDRLPHVLVRRARPRLASARRACAAPLRRLDEAIRRRVETGLSR